MLISQFRSLVSWTRWIAKCISYLSQQTKTYCLSPLSSPKIHAPSIQQLHHHYILLTTGYIMIIITLHGANRKLRYFMIYWYLRRKWNYYWSRNKNRMSLGNDIYRVNLLNNIQQDFIIRFVDSSPQLKLTFIIESYISFNNFLFQMSSFNLCWKKKEKQNENR